MTHGSDNARADERTAWRRSQRNALVAQRERTPEPQRAAWSARITAHFIGGFEIPAESVVGYCWPYRSEYDARPAIAHWRARGVTAALPEVAGENEPLRFRTWWPEAPMRAGVYGIPVPAGTALVEPDVLIVSMNGFDARGYRLGYGGGYFDRTIGALARRVVAIGVAYELASVETIDPQAHDAPMDFIVTEAGARVAGGAPLATVNDEASRRCFASLLDARHLPRATHGLGAHSSPVCYAAEFPGYFGEDGSGSQEP